MRAMIIPRHGGEDVLTYVTDFPKPAPGKGEALVRVGATGVNQVDLLVRNGYPGVTPSLPHIAGGDIAGVVEALGEGVESVAVGSRTLVYPIIACGTCALCKEGKPNLCLNWQYFGMHVKGGYAEYVVVPEKNLLPLPDSVSFEEAVALPVAGLTAYHALKTVGEVKTGQTFFIWGGAGGLGTMAIQIAKRLGAAKVIGTASSAERLDVMRQLGADHVFNRLTDDVPTEVKKLLPAGVDLIIDYVGPETFPKSFEMLKKGGQMLVCGIITGRETTLNIHMTYLKHLSVKGLYLGTMEELRELISLVAEGKVRPYIGAKFSLKDAAKAQRLLVSGEAAGKIVLTV